MAAAATAKRPKPSSASFAYNKKRPKQQQCITRKEEQLLLLLRPESNEIDAEGDQGVVVEENEEGSTSASEQMDYDEETSSQSLLLGLPDHLAQICLSTVPPSLLFSVCRSWRRLIYSPSFPPFLSLYALLHHDTTAQTSSISFASFDPIASMWVSMPPPPLPNPPPLIYHPSFLSRRLPVQSVAASGRLVLVAGSTHSLLPALARPLVFDPSCHRWQLGPPFPLSPRRWCAAGSARGRVFLAGGVGSCYDAAIARSAACWDPSSSSSLWEHLPPLRDGRFTREAVEAVSSNGKLCMVNLRGRAAKQGAVFDLKSKQWEDMPPALLAGWTGPAAAADDDEDEDGIFVVDEASGALRVYEWGTRKWKTLVEPNERLKGATEMTTGGGKVCVVVDNGGVVVVIDVKTRRRIWTVEVPQGKMVVSVHVLPRMGRPD